jgi:4-carboxymuconolactone decarboxylase
VQTSLVGQVVSGSLSDFAPAINVFLTSHLFGEIFARDTLDHQTWEAATLAGLAGLTASQLYHLVTSLNS